MIYAWGKLMRLKARIKRINDPTARRLRTRSKEGKTVRREYVQTDELDWTEFDEFCYKYQKDKGAYTMFTMIIQLFTLLGILGTVAGLLVALLSMNDISQSDQLLNGVRFALSSTMWGLILAILFKAFDVLIGSFWVEYIEDGIARFKNNYREETTPAETEGYS